MATESDFDPKEPGRGRLWQVMPALKKVLGLEQGLPTEFGGLDLRGIQILGFTNAYRESELAADGG